MKSILLLGAGLVTPPLVRYLLDSGFRMTIADQVPEKAEALAADRPNAAAVTFSVEDTETLEEQIRNHDLTISLLPAPLHPLIAGNCIRLGKSMVTTSYISPEMTALDAAANDAGVMILNEIGVDPGLDHMSAMRVIDDVRARGGWITSFKSYCGGLPAPDCNDNPFGYKFSWSPRAVCTAGTNAARYLEAAEEVNIPGPELFNNYDYLTVEGLGELEAYPNRDSLAYIDVYGLKKIETIFRGTFRYRGWCETLKGIADLGLLSERPVTYPKSLMLVEFTLSFLTVPATGDLRKDLAAQLQLDVSSPILDRLEWLGLMGQDEVPITGRETTPLDVLAALMFGKMSYGEGERDMIALCHYFTASFPNGEREEITSTLIAYGEPDGDSAMASTVGLPAAIGAKLVLEGRIVKPGVHVPVTPDVYVPVLEELERLGISCVETTRKI